MRAIIPCLMIGLVTGTSISAETPADRIRDLYEAVPYERVQASPQVDILAHIEQMRARKNSDEDEFAVPDLDMETVLRETETEDVLMNPGVLEAIARMPPDRAAEVLRMIEDRRAGLNPLQDVPALSMSEGEGRPESLALRGWRLYRDEAGAPFLERDGDDSSRVMLVPSMILADFGRVVSIQDDAEAFRMTLESGDVIEGEVREPLPLGGAEDAGDVQVTPEEVRNFSGTDPVRPQARPENVDGDVAVQTQLTVPPVRSLRPRLRPAGLPGNT
jgi:hypothetical protein